MYNLFVAGRPVDHPCVGQSVDACVDGGGVSNTKSNSGKAARWASDCTSLTPVSVSELLCHCHGCCCRHRCCCMNTGTGGSKHSPPSRCRRRLTESRSVNHQHRTTTTATATATAVFASANKRIETRGWNAAERSPRRASQRVKCSVGKIRTQIDVCDGVTDCNTGGV